MASARTKILLKILLLLGTPVGVIVGVFVTGLYLGSESWQQSVLDWESKWLHWDVPPDLRKHATKNGTSNGGTPGEGVQRGQDSANSSSNSNGDVENLVQGVSATDAPRAERTPNSNPRTSEQLSDLVPDQLTVQTDDQKKRPGATAVAESSALSDSPLPAMQSPPGKGEPTDGSDQDPATALLDGSFDYRSLMALPVTVRIKVVVDQEFIAAHGDWIDYVQRTINMADQQYQRQFGIALSLYAVGSWSVATAGLSSQQLLEDLHARTREGADVLLGMTARPLDHRIAGKADQAEMDQRFNGAYAVVYSAYPAEEPHLFGCLHELGHLFGAIDIENASSLDYQRGSFMSYAAPAKGSQFWIDDGNRRRILARKGYPFWPEHLSNRRSRKP